MVRKNQGQGILPFRVHSGDRARVVAQVNLLTLPEFLKRNQPAPDFSEQSPEDGLDSFKGSKSTGFVAFKKLHQRRRLTYATTLAETA